MYLGYHGDKVKRSATNAAEFDWFTSRFGGSVSVLQSAVLASIAQEEDAKNGQLVAANSVLNPNYKPPQGEDDEELRCLIVLVCNELRCWKVGRPTWKAFRYQPHKEESEEEIKRKKDEKTAAFRKTLQTPAYKDEDLNPAEKKTPVNTPVKSVFATPSWGSPFGGGFSSSPASSSSAKPAETASPATTTADLEELLRLRDMSIAAESKKTTKTYSAAAASTSSPSSASSTQESASSPAASISSATATPKKSADDSKEDDVFQFVEAYMEFDKEPELGTSYSGATNQGHEKKAGESLNEGSEGTWAGEEYESSVSAKDKPFHRFQKRLQRSPEQCLRYWRGAEPLFSTSDKPKTLPFCSSCGGKRVPETQLTPALIFMLQPVNEKHQINIDFGTVIVYTCGKSCTDPKRPLHLEHVEIQRGM